MLAVVDTGPLYAVVDADDQDHERCVRALEAPGVRVFIPAMVVAEATYLVGSRLGPKVEAAFLAGLAGLDVEAPSATDWPRIAQLVETYADFPLGGTDASVLALAERLGAETIITLDLQHFEAVRSASSPAWRLLPE